MTHRLSAVVLAAGLGTRMRSRRPKHLHPLLGRRLVDWTIEAVRGVGPEQIVVVASPEARAEFDGVDVAVQTEPRGTGHATAAARAALADPEGDVLVVPGDSPLLTAETLRSLVEAHAGPATLLTVESARDLAYGRVVRNASGAVERIVEERDASPEELEIRELNTGVYVFSGPSLWRALERIDAENAQGELYLTDAIGVLAGEGRPVAAHAVDEIDAVQGVNTHAELAHAASVLRHRILSRHMADGVAIVDPATTWIEAEVTIEADAVVHPFTVLRGRTSVGEDAEIGPHVVAADAEIGARATVGPFCYLRPGTVLSDDAKAGTFVEVKNATIGERAKVPHLSYIGDADIGEDSNIGAGAITANYRAERYDEKQRTVIGRNVHTGSDNVFVPPVEVGDDAWIGAGSTITEDVPPGALAIARARQVNKEGYYRRGDGRDDD